MIKYDVNVENRTVTATISGCADDLVHRLQKKSSMAMTTDLIQAGKLPEVFTAVAKCHPDDTFDEAVGKAVAKRKLLNKYHTARNKACNRVESTMDSMAEAMSDAASRETQRIIQMMARYNKEKRPGQEINR